MVPVDITEMWLTALFMITSCYYFTLTKFKKDYDTFICLQFALLLSFLNFKLSILLLSWNSLILNKSFIDSKFILAFFKKRKEKGMGIFVKNVKGQLCKSSRESAVVTVVSDAKERASELLCCQWEHTPCCCPIPEPFCSSRQTTPFLWTEQAWQYWEGCIVFSTLSPPSISVTVTVDRVPCTRPQPSKAPFLPARMPNWGCAFIHLVLCVLTMCLPVIVFTSLLRGNKKWHWTGSWGATTNLGGSDVGEAVLLDGNSMKKSWRFPATWLSQGKARGQMGLEVGYMIYGSLFGGRRRERWSWRGGVGQTVKCWALVEKTEEKSSLFSQETLDFGRQCLHHSCSPSL